MMLDGLEEPAFTTSSANLAPRWDNFAEIPPVLAARLRVPGPQISLNKTLHVP
jgi:hypothetical protein